MSGAIRTPRALLRTPGGVRPFLAASFQSSIGNAIGYLRVLSRLGQELADLYIDEVADHRESRGDNGQLFGMKLWTHGWFRYEDLFADDPFIRVASENGSWALHVGRLRVGVYRQGSHVGTRT